MDLVQPFLNATKWLLQVSIKAEQEMENIMSIITKEEFLKLIENAVNCMQKSRTTIRYRLADNTIIYDCSGVYFKEVK